MSDGVSALLRLLTSSFGAGHPIRLFCGVSLGLLIKISVSVIATLYPDYPVWTTLSGYSASWYILIVTPLLFIPLAFGRGGALEAPVQEINTIKLMIAEGEFSAVEKRRFWRLLVEKYIKGIQPNLSRSRSVKHLADEVASDLEAKQ